MTNLHQLDVSSVSTLDMVKVHPQKYITLDELVKEVMPLLSDCVPNTIEEIPVFMDLGAKDLSRFTNLPKNICWKSPLEKLHEAA